LAGFFDYAHAVYFFKLIFGHYFPNNGHFLWVKVEPPKKLHSELVLVVMFGMVLSLNPLISFSRMHFRVLISLQWELVMGEIGAK